MAVRRKIGQVGIRRIVIQMDNDTEYNLYPASQQVQVVTFMRDGRVFQTADVSMEVFMGLMQDVIARYE